MPKNNSNERLDMKNAILTPDRNQLLASWVSVPAVPRSDPDCQWFPALDVTRTPEEYLIEIDLPGLNHLALPADAEFSAMTTFFHNGVLELRVPRALRQASLEGAALAA